MMRIKIVCDSTFGLEEEFIKEKNIEIVPLNVIIDNKSYRDLFDIQLNEVLEAVTNGSKVSSSQPAPSLYRKVFRELKEEGYTDILCFTISSTLSGTYSSANLGAQDIDDINIHIVDTLSASIGAEILLREAILALEEGRSLDDVLNMLENLKKNAVILLSMENLKYLRLSGRITRIKATIGSLIHVKPILEYFNGKLTVHSKFRTGKAVFNYLLERISSAFSEAKSKFILYLSHVQSLEKVLKLKAMIEEKIEDLQIRISPEITPVVAINIGYGGIGVAWTYEE
jgi:DegV family protein with EDD domain